MSTDRQTKPKLDIAVLDFGAMPLVLANAMGALVLLAVVHAHASVAIVCYAQAFTDSVVHCSAQSSQSNHSLTLY